MREMKDSGVASIGTIPTDWSIRKFKTLAKLCNGREVCAEGGDVPVYGSGGVFKWTNKPLHTGESLLMGRKGTIDNPMLVNGSFWTVDTTTPIISKKPVNPGKSRDRGTEFTTKLLLLD